MRENGKNMYAIQVNENIYILDCGLKYPEKDILGIDLIIPDFSYLREHKDKIMGVFLTHGHADAMGALPYFLKELKVPVYGSYLTLELAKLTFKKFPELSKFDDFHVVDDKKVVDLGDVSVSFFKTTHTIPDSLGVVLKTDAGQIVYTGDFKLDPTVQEKYATDYNRLFEIGKSKVLAVLSDSYNAENIKPKANELDVGRSILETIKYHDGRIIISAVSANILRIQQIIDAASLTDRKIVLVGDDIDQIIKTGLKHEYLTLPAEDIIVTPDKLPRLDPSETIILATGRMGEPVHGLQKMAERKMGALSIQKNDLVFISTTPSTAMEAKVARIKDLMYRLGAKVKIISEDVNAIGHASKNDLQLLLSFLKPINLIPIQGEYRLLSAHARIAKEVGLIDNHVHIPSKGEVIQVTDDGMELGEGFEINDTMVDGSGIGDIGTVVLRDRKSLSEDGVFIAVITIDLKRKQIIKRAKVMSKGFVYVKDNRELLKEASELVETTIKSYIDSDHFSWSQVKLDIRSKLSKFLYDETHRHPVVIPVVMEIRSKTDNRVKSS